MQYNYLHQNKLDSGFKDIIIVSNGGKERDDALYFYLFVRILCNFKLLVTKREIDFFFIMGAINFIKGSRRSNLRNCFNKT